MVALIENRIAAARAFDNIARQYDIAFDSRSVTQNQRQRIYTVIEDLVKPPSRIFDINCGTGTDALALAGKGSGVVAVDVPREMIAEGRRKSAGSATVEFGLASFEDLNHLPKQTVDLVLSNFGGLNAHVT